MKNYPVSIVMGLLILLGLAAGCVSKRVAQPTNDAVRRVVQVASTTKSPVRKSALGLPPLPFAMQKDVYHSLWRTNDDGRITLFYLPQSFTNAPSVNRTNAHKITSHKNSRAKSVVSGPAADEAFIFVDTTPEFHGMYFDVEWNFIPVGAWTIQLAPTPAGAWFTIEHLQWSDPTALFSVVIKVGDFGLGTFAGGYERMSQ